MKDIYYFFVFVLSLFFAACDSSILENEVASPIKVEKEITPKTWQEQVDFAKNHANVMTKLNINQVKFVRHTYLGKINTEKQIANLWLDLFADEVEMVVYPHGNITDYEIVPLKEVREKYQTLEMDKYIEFLKGQLDPVVKIGTELIELEWEYKGKAVHSLGIISNGKIVYDHIGSMIVIQGDMSQDFDVYSSIKPIKTRTEEVGMYERSWEISNKGGSSYLGEYSWKYDIRCHAFFNSNGILVNFTTYAKGDSGFGWCCEAKAKQTGGEIGVSDYCQFTWGYAYRLGTSVSVTIQGTDVSISSGATHASGTFQLRK